MATQLTPELTHAAFIGAAGRAAPAAPEPEIERGRDGDERASRGRPTAHGLTRMRKTLRSLTTKRLDGRSSVAVAVRSWKADVRTDLGGELTRAQETLLEVAAQTWLLVTTLDDWLARQPSLVTKKRQLLPVVMQRQQLADSLARLLERLGLDRRGVKEVTALEYATKQQS